MAKMSNACKKWLQENTAEKIAVFESLARRLDMSIMDIDRMIKSRPPEPGLEP